MADSKIYYSGIEIYVTNYRKGNIAPVYVTHLFPFSGKWLIEKTGNNPTSYDIEGFFRIDGDYALLKPVYETILAQDTPQTLTLPDVGMVQAVCKVVDMVESADKNGIVNCTLQFLYAPISGSSFNLISIIENPSSVLTTLETNGISSITSGFSSSLSGMSLADIETPITGCLTSIGTTATNLVSTAGQVTGIDGLLSGSTLGIYSQAPMNSNIIDGIDTSMSNNDIVSAVSSAASSYYSDTISSINTNISSATTAISTLI